MTEGTIPSTDKKKLLLYYCQDMLKTSQRESKFFELSRDVKIRKKDITLQWLHINGFVAIVFASPFGYVYKQSYHVS